jgi:hypothetical protein
MSTLIRESSSSRVWKRQTSIERPRSTHADVSAFVFQVARRSTTEPPTDSQ